MFWGLTPREFQALASVWESQREFEVSLYAELHATLRNTALDVAFQPPEGKAWTREMFLPGYKPSGKAEEFDWRTQKQMMNLIGKKPDPKKRKADTAARASTKDRFRMAEEAKQRGATKQEIRLILEA